MQGINKEKEIKQKDSRLFRWLRFKEENKQTIWMVLFLICYIISAIFGLSYPLLVKLGQVPEWTSIFLILVPIFFLLFITSILIYIKPLTHRWYYLKCRFFKICKSYNRTSLVCRNNNLARNYYGYNKPCGCYRKQLNTCS